MRLSTIITVFRKELTELLRDRRSLMVMFGVPLVVYPLLFMAVGSVAKGKAQEGRQRSVKVAVVNADQAPGLVKLLQEPDRRFEVLTTPESADALQKDKVSAIIEVPPHAQADWMAGVDAQLTVRVDRSRSLTGAAEDRLDAALDAYAQQVVHDRLAAKGVGPEVLKPITRQTIDIASREQRSGKFLAQTIPMLLLITGMLGALFPALNTTTTEKELGTLETLLVSPASRTDLLIAKGLLVCCCSLLTAGLNMASMSAVFLQVAKNTAITAATGPTTAAATAGIGGGLGISPWLILHAYAAAVPALILFSALVLCVGLIARTYREASSFATPVMMLPLAGMIVAMIDPPTTDALLMTPVVSTTLIIRDILTSRSNWGDFALVWASSLAYAGLVISMAARLFTNEQLVNPAWEPLSLKGLKRKGTRRLRMPTLDEAVVLVLMVPLVQFYAGPALRQYWSDKEGGNLNAPMLILSIQVVSIVLPMLVVGAIGRWNWKAVFPLNLPGPTAIPGAIVTGLGLAGIGIFYSLAYRSIFAGPPSQSNTAVYELIGSTADTSKWLAILTFGLIPGVFEEVLFRGAVLSGFRRSLKTGVAVVVTGLLFALVHLDWAGFPQRAILGGLLGWVLVRTCSLIPGMLLHAVYNGTTVAVLLFYGDKLVRTTAAGPVPDPTGRYGLLLLVGGLALTVGGLTLLFTGNRRPIAARATS